MSDNMIAETEPTTEPMVEAPQDTDEPGDDTFPRSAVERLRRESAGYRDRAKTAEDRLGALQRQIVEQKITAAGMRPAAVFAVTGLDDLIASDGTVDTDGLTAAMATAREQLGITNARKRHAADREGFKSGASGAQAGGTGPSFKSAFKRRER